MIVKDEAKVLRRCLESVKPYIDAWSISDTGSTDGTQSLIREILGDIPGELIERPWQNFATNRNEAIDNGLKFEPDYFLTLDADEKLETQPGFSLEGLTADCYQFNFQMAGTAGKWPRNVLFRPDLRYRYVVDETLDLAGRTLEILPACLVISHTDGARNADGLVAKYERDCVALRAALEVEPDEPRYWFYLAQRLMGAGHYAEAIEAYKRRIDLPGGLAPERGYSKLMIGQCLEQLDTPFQDLQTAYLDAWQTNPNRAEPIYALACLHSIRGEHSLAELYARAAQRIPRPTDPLPVDESVYAYRAVELLAGALAEQGKLADAADLLDKLLVLPQLPEEERERVRENIALIRSGIDAPASAEKLGPDEQAYEGQARLVRSLGVFSGFRRMGLEFLASFAAQSLPSPLRWIWILLVALLGRWASVLGAVASVALVPWALAPRLEFTPALLAIAGSPLLFLVGRRRFQDAPVAALTIAGLGFALRGDPIGLALVTFALLGVKEAGLLSLPAFALAWMLSGAPAAPLAVSLAAGVTGAALAARALLGGMAWPIFRAASRGHGTPYTQEHQQGTAHRLVVDLVLISPLTTIAALFGPAWLIGLALALLIAHTAAPVRNVRLVLAADLLLRASAVAAFGWWIAPALAVDLYISRRLRAVYDPVTAALTSQLGMSR